MSRQAVFGEKIHEGKSRNKSILVVSHPLDSYTI